MGRKILVICDELMKLVALHAGSVMLVSGFNDASENEVLFAVEVICLPNFFLCLIRRQQEAELKLLEEETARRVEEAIQKMVEESLNSEDIKLEIQRQIDEGRKRLANEVATQLEKEKTAALIEARQKEV